jgi:Zn-dependent protease
MTSPNIERLGDTPSDKKNWITRYSFFVGKAGGIPIYIHFSFALIFFLITYSLSIVFFPRTYPGLEPIVYVAMGLTGALISLFSLLIHELGHSAVAKKYGVNFERIILFALGGLALTPYEMKVPKNEIHMALAGPWISFIISGMSFAFWLIVFQSRAFALQNSPIAGILFYSALINVAIATFNLVPIFPSDGGRVLRAIMSMRTHDHIKGTKAAIRIGVMISMFLVFMGIFVGMTYSFLSGLWLMILAFFLIRGSKWYYQQYEELSSHTSTL